MTQTVPSNPKLSWIPDTPDHRDYVFKLDRTTPKLPTHVNILGVNNPIEDQGDLGSCTGCSSTSALEISIPTNRPLSKLMAYYNARQIEGSTQTDAGASIRDAIKGLATVGVAYEQTWPYDVSKFAVVPSSQAYTEARTLVGAMSAFQYVRVTSLTDLKANLAAGYPVTFGFSVPEWFVSPSFNNILRFPTAKEAIIGGHAVVAVGYDDRYKDKIVWVRNSWGNAWGIKGYFKMTQDWFTNPAKLADDLWVIKPK